MNGRNNIYETENGKSVNRRDSGFTLIETVIALLVLTIGLLGMAALSISVMQGNKSSNRISTATAVAQDKMEELRGLGYDNLPASDSGDIDINGLSYSWDVETVTTRYDADGDVTTDPDDPVLTITKKVTVTVEWEDAETHSVSTQMLFTR